MQSQKTNQVETEGESWQANREHAPPKKSNVLVQVSWQMPQNKHSSSSGAFTIIRFPSTRNSYQCIKQAPQLLIECIFFGFRKQMHVYQNESEKQNTTKTRLPVAQKVSETARKHAIQKIHQESLYCWNWKIGSFKNLQGRKLSIYWNIYIYTHTLIWLSCLLATRTEENSKAKGYILNNCETQSTHCIGHPNITS